MREVGAGEGLRLQMDGCRIRLNILKVIDVIIRVYVQV